MSMRSPFTAFQRTPNISPPMLALTKPQDEVWEQTRAAFLMQAPHLATIFYTLMNPRSTGHIAYFTGAIPIAATDGTNLFLNPDTALSNKYSVGNRVFMVCHEIFHNVFNHMGMMLVFRRRGYILYPDGLKLPYYHEVMNVAEDYVINALLIKSHMGVFHKTWLYDENLSDGENTSLDVYRKLFESGRVKEVGTGKPCLDGKGGKKGKGKGKGAEKSDEGAGGDIEVEVDTDGKVRFDEHWEPGTGEGKPAAEAEMDRNEQEWQTAVASGMAAAEAQGRLPDVLKRVFGTIMAPKVDWKDKVRALVTRMFGADEYSWRTLDRRLIVRGIGAPGRIGHATGTVVIGLDTSGSIYACPRTLDMFFAEMAGILEDLNPEVVWVVHCDAQVHRVDEVRDMADLEQVHEKGVVGGGGTSFIPVFDWIEEQGIEPDALIYLTDLMGTFPGRAPDYPVLWATICPGEFPWGEQVMIPRQVEG